MKTLFGNVYSDKTVLVTGHTGFKGSWLSLWLSQMGAKVVGYSLEPNTNPSHYPMLDFSAKMTSITGDLSDKSKLAQVFDDHQPEIVFHLAAQSLVRKSYSDPSETFATNVIGTLNVFDVARLSKSVEAIVNITSDKCYENREWIWGYRESDPLGGHDPYSASKACSEILTSCYRNSFFNVESFGKSHKILLASCRAGNVIGGGDWNESRLIPDLIQSTATGKAVEIRNPIATRPWQHVLEPLSGYLLIGQELLNREITRAGGWNFGPGNLAELTVEEVAQIIKSRWKEIQYVVNSTPNQLHEAGLLKLDCSKANSELRWRQIWDTKLTFEKTVDWYRNFYKFGTVGTLEDIESYVKTAKSANAVWAN